METIRLKNYRCFSDTGEIKLQPVNILLGKNSVGKSSFLKFFPLLKQSRVKHPNGIFLWYAEDVDFKDFKNTVKNGEGNIEIAIQFERSTNDTPISQKNKEPRIQNIEFVLTISGHPKDENLDYLSHLKISFADTNIEIIFTLHEDRNFYQPLEKILINGNPVDIEAGIITELSDEGFLPRIFFKSGEKGSLSYTSRPENNDKNLAKMMGEDDDFHHIILGRRFRNADYYSTTELIDKFDNYSDKIKKKLKTSDRFIELIYLQQLNNFIADINGYIDELARNIYYIQPVRANAKRYYRLQNLAVDEIDSHGDNLPMYLNSLTKTAKEHLNSWLEPLFKFKLDVKPKEGHIQINIIETENKNQASQIMRNLVDVGFGYSQLLPIIVQIWNALKNNKSKPSYLLKSFDSPKIIVIEQPELHLHPKMMTYFAEMLISLIKDPSCTARFIIETHSETLIEALGKKISFCNADRENKLTVDPKSFQVLIFENKEDGQTTTIKATHYDAGGFVNEWPYGFFSGEK